MRKNPLPKLVLEQHDSSSLSKAVEAHPSPADGEALEAFDAGEGRVSLTSSSEIPIQAFWVNLPKKRKRKRKLTFLRLVDMQKASFTPL